MTTQVDVKETQVDAKFEVGGWDENPFDEGVGVGKLTRAIVTKTYTGDIEGTSNTEWLMDYEPDKSATFVGMERIKGTVAGRHGSLVITHRGTFKDGVAQADLSVVSGTNELKGARGSGTFRADPAGSIALRVTFDTTTDR